MTQRKALPVAPRPYPGESARSWLARTAARYDLDTHQLVACLRGGREYGGDRSALALIDWREDSDLENLLTRAARLDRASISGLRVPVRNLPDPGAWHRALLVWCPECVRDDFGRYGEVHERAVWRLGCCVACPTHGSLLECLCQACFFGHCSFSSISGRQRLICSGCRSPVDAGEPSRTGANIAALRGGMLWLTRDSALRRSALEMQSAILKALVGVAPTGLWHFGLPASQFALIVRDLVGVFGWPLGIPLAAREDSTTSLGSPHRAFEIEPQSGFKILGIIGSVLTDMAGGCPARLERTTLWDTDPDGFTADLPWLVRRLSGDARAWLAATAQGWGAVLAQCVGRAVEAHEKHEKAVRTAEERVRLSVALARANATWSKASAKRDRAAAINRIAARARRRAAARRTPLPEDMDRRNEPATSRHDRH